MCVWGGGVLGVCVGVGTGGRSRLMLCEMLPSPLVVIHQVGLVDGCLQ